MEINLYLNYAPFYIRRQFICFQVAFHCYSEHIG